MNRTRRSAQQNVELVDVVERLPPDDADDLTGRGSTEKKVRGLPHHIEGNATPRSER